MYGIIIDNKTIIKNKIRIKDVIIVSKKLEKIE
jgi:hypothetical protein